MKALINYIRNWWYCRPMEKELEWLDEEIAYYKAMIKLLSSAGMGNPSVEGKLARCEHRRTVLALKIAQKKEAAQ